MIMYGVNVLMEKMYKKWSIKIKGYPLLRFSFRLSKSFKIDFFYKTACFQGDDLKRLTIAS